MREKMLEAKDMMQEEMTNKREITFGKSIPSMPTSGVGKVCVCGGGWGLVEVKN